MNLTFVYVPTPEGFEFGKGSINNLFTAMIAKEAYLALGSVKRNFSFYTFFDLTNTYTTTKLRWYVPCYVKYPRWSNMFRILSVELWLVLIISIVIAAISTTLVGRYSCTSEWQGYKTLTSSLTNLWAVIVGVSVSTMPRAPSLRPLFLAWVCFSVSFGTLFQAFLTTFLVDSGYKPPIQNMDELIASGIKLAYSQENNFLFENGKDSDVPKGHRNHVYCSSYSVYLDWTMYQKNILILLLEINVEFLYAMGDLVGKNSKPLLCRLEDGVFFPVSPTTMMFRGDPLLRRVNGIIDRLVEAGLYNYWNSLEVNRRKIEIGKIAIIQPLDEYYSFNLYHMQSAFCLLLMAWCFSALCFMVEVLYNCVLRKIMWSW